MTLHKAIEAAREALTSAKHALANGQFMYNKYANDSWKNGYQKDLDNVKKILSTLPANPMSEDEIFGIVIKYCIERDLNNTTMNVIRALRDADCLYVREK